jgi:hypothetical protein
MIKIAIATNKNFSQFSLPVILKSLIDCQINLDDIIVFHAGYDEREEKIIDGIKNVFLNHNSFEYSPLIDICENNLESEYWFLIHDTCKVGPRFKELLYNIPVDKPEKLALKSKPAMSMGLYKYTYLKSVEQKIFTIKNTDYSHESIMKWKLWGVPNEDFILWMTEPNPKFYNNIDEFSIVDNKNWYGTNTIRRTEYYPSLDIYKNKSNWGQTGNNMVLHI